MKAYVNPARFAALHQRNVPPHHVFEGKTWRSGDRLWTIVRASDGSLSAVSAEVVFTDGRERFPRGWRAAFAAYLRQWPASATEVSAWANTSVEDRICLAVGLLNSADRIGRRTSRCTAARILAGCRP